MSGFRDIIGHEETIEHLKTAVCSGRISQAYLLVGEKGMGKRTIAQAFAETIQCETLRKKLEAGRQESGIRDGIGDRLSDIDACGVCGSCRKAETHNHPDIIQWRYQKDTSISVDDIRGIVKDVGIRPYSSEYKIYILPDAQKMTREAQNALLKTLEEPPRYAVMILLSTSRDAMLETILSRCVVLPLKPVSDSRVKKYLTERIGIEEYQAEICAAFAQGNVGRASALASDENFYSLLERVVQILTHIKEWDVSDIIVLIRDMDRGKDASLEVLDLFTLWYRDVLFFKATNNPDGILFREQIVQIRETAQKSSYDGIETILEAVRKAKERLSANVRFDLTMQLLLLTMKEN